MGLEPGFRRPGSFDGAGRKRQLEKGNWRFAFVSIFTPLFQGVLSMTPLRQKMIHELELHRKSPNTIEAYVTAVAQLARHYGRSPDAIAVEEIRDFLHHLITVRKVAFSPSGKTVANQSWKPRPLH